MASTYTDNLRLEQIGIGESDNTWGTKLNTTLGLVDAAISGLVTIATTGGTTTLSTANNAADEARVAILKITGTLVSNATIIIPDKTKKYTVWNATSGAFTVTIKASGTGVAIAQGKVADVFCDGTITYATGTDGVLIGFSTADKTETLTNKTLGATLNANSNKITNLAGATLPGDATSLSVVQALISGGGTPSNIGITDLGLGSATATQIISVNAAGTAVVGTATQTSNAGKFLTTNGTTMSWSYVNSPWQIKTTTYVAVAGDRIMADTSGGAFTITLPANPAANDRVVIADYAGTFSTNNLTVTTGAVKIMGLAEDYICDLSNESRVFDYIDVTEGWRVV